MLYASLRSCEGTFHEDPPTLGIVNPWSPPSALTNNFKPPHIDHAPPLSNGVSQRSYHWWTTKLEMPSGLWAMLDLNKLAANFHGGLAYHLPGKATTYDHNRHVET